MAFPSNPFSKKNRFAGAAFLMATAAIGPGFITQTTVFTGKLFTSFGFAILISILIDLGVQLNIWRATAVRGVSAPVFVNQTLPGFGYFLSALIVLGGFIFNIGNMGGCGLAMYTIFGLPYEYGAVLSLAIAMVLFLIREFGKAMDAFVKVLGILMIGLMIFIVFKSKPPIGQIIHHSLMPQKVDLLIIITLVGGTVGGYISFAGAQRMLDSGVVGYEHLKEIHRGAISGILLAGLMRILLFVAVAGVVSNGVTLPSENPAAFIFEWTAGKTGRMIFGIILWCASITSVIASAYTSIGFWGATSPFIKKNNRIAITIFMLISTAIFVFLGNPTQLLIKAGTLNGLVLPFALVCVMWAIGKNKQLSVLQKPPLLYWSGWGIALVLSLAGAFALWNF